MALTISQILAPVTTAQARNTLVTILVSSGIPADRWKSGGIAFSILTAAATLFSLTTTQITQIIAYFFLPISTGFGLQLLAQYGYGVTVPQATFASGPFALGNSGGAIYTVLAGQFSVQNTVTGQTYTNVTDISIPSGPPNTVTATIQIQCTVPGSQGTANPGDISTILTPLLGVSGSNPISLVGIDQPSDAAIRTLCLASLGARSVRGPRSAYVFAIMTATNPLTTNPVNINRWTVSNASHTGIVGILVTGPDGTTDPFDLQGVKNNIELIARPDEVTAITTAATAIPYSPTIQSTVIAPTSVSPSDIQTAMATAVTNYLKAYPIGGQFVQDDAHPGGFQGLVTAGIYGAMAQGAASIPGCIFVSARGAPDLSLTSTQVATNGVTIALPTILPAQQSAVAA